MSASEGMGRVSNAIAWPLMFVSVVTFLVLFRAALKEVMQAAIHDELENDLYVIRNELKYVRDMLEAQRERQYPPKDRKSVV